MSQEEDSTIFDRLALRKNRAKSTRGEKDAAFLLEEVMDELGFRLSAINRQFETCLSLGTHMGIGDEKLLNSGKINDLIHLDPLPEMLKSIKGRKLVAEEDCLPFKNASLDFVISPLSLQWVNDLPGCLIQIRRALKDDGLFMAALIGGESLVELRSSFLASESKMTDGVSPRISPFVDVKTLGSLLQRAGFALPVVDREIRTVRYDSPLDLMRDLKHMGATNVLNSRSKKFLRRDVFSKMIDHYISEFSDRDGRIRASFEIIYVSAWAPHESQQKPLKPGSATHSLREVLKANQSNAE